MAMLRKSRLITKTCANLRLAKIRAITPKIRNFQTFLWIVVALFILVALIENYWSNAHWKVDIRITRQNDNSESSLVTYDAENPEEKEDINKSNSSDRNLWQKRYPTAIIIGVQKCGTEALKRFLRINSRVRFPSDKVAFEPHFFDKQYKRGFRFYRSLMPKSLPGDVTMEKTPNYFEIETVTAKIYKFNPDMKLLVILRNPVDRAISNWFHGRHMGQFKNTTLKKLIFDSKGEMNPNSILLYKGIYHIHLSRWLSYFPRKNILILDGDKFVKDPVPILRSAEDFLGLNPQISYANLTYSKSKGFFCVDSKYVKKVSCLGKYKGHDYRSKIESDIYNKLVEFYRPHNRRFIQLTGLTFTGIQP